MARQVGSYRIRGTIDEICFYKMEGAYFARSKSSLDRKRYYSDPAFEGSRRSSAALAIAAPLASKLYKMMVQEKKGRRVFQLLVGRIKIFVKDGLNEQEIEHWFRRVYLGEVPASKARIKKKTRTKSMQYFTRFDYHNERGLFTERKRGLKGLKGRRYRTALDRPG